MNYSAKLKAFVALVQTRGRKESDCPFLMDVSASDVDVETRSARVVIPKADIQTIATQKKGGAATGARKGAIIGAAAGAGVGDCRDGEDACQ